MPFMTRSCGAGYSAAFWLVTEKAPITGRSRAIATTLDEEAELGVRSLEDLLRQGLSLRPSSHPASKKVQRIGDKLKHTLALTLDEAHKQHWLVRLRSSGGVWN
jgi:hypothetical protein